MNKIIGFFAYPSSPYGLTAVIKEAIDKANRAGGCHFKSWEENDIAGRSLTAPIFTELDNSNILIADITKLNFNVTYEIGYAIGVGRRVFLVRNKEYENNQEKITEVGIYDTLGYESYSNQNELSQLITSISDLKPINTAIKPNRSTPLYVLETPIKGSAMVHIISKVKKARLFYRSFTPSEESRMSAIDAITHVASSYGVLVPLLAAGKTAADTHNIRAAFVSGLSHGMGKPTLILQDKDGPLTPLDVRDFVKEYTRPEDIRDHIHVFSLSVYEKMQESVYTELPTGNLLSNLVIGDPMAENEFQSLGNYYLQTDEFGRTQRGEVNLVVGRKGTGKTALFSQVRNKKRADKKNVVVDLKPEGYQLVKLKEEVLDYLSAGAKNHLIVAFWEYLLYLEVCYKVLEKDKDRHLRDNRLYEDYQKLSSIYKDSAYVQEGDFSERLSMLSNSIALGYSSYHGKTKDTRLTADEVTSIIHSHEIRELRDTLSVYLKHKKEIWILFDNLDKGWSTHGLAKGDITILRCLIDASRKIQREMIRIKHNFHTVVFVRNDVYQLLMEESADFGKESKAILDWSDPELLREMIRRRLIQNNLPNEAEFLDLWSMLCVTHYKGEETSQYFIDRSLMRPRNLLKIINVCRGFAVNLQHQKIEEMDIEKGLKAYSNDLIVDADHELTDIEPSAKNLIYQFVGENSEFTHDDLLIMLEINCIPEAKMEKVIEFLLYYGFFGLKYNDNETQYIFDVGYNMQLLKTRMRKNKLAITYEMNPAFWPSLGIYG